MASTTRRFFGNASRTFLYNALPSATRPLRRRGRILTICPASQAKRQLNTTSYLAQQPSMFSTEDAHGSPVDTIGGPLGEMNQSREGRWRSTPSAMKAPYQLHRVGKPPREAFKVNEDPEVLDQFYARFLGGQHWPKTLPDELKWLAITHKSFDQGRRGFNDRLAYIGMRLIFLELSKAIIATTPVRTEEPDPLGRKPFEHPALAGLSNYGRHNPLQVFNRDDVMALGLEYGLPSVIRWVPKDPSQLEASGLKAVVMGAMQAIVGAVLLQKGGAEATYVVRDKIVNRLL